MEPLSEAYFDSLRRDCVADLELAIAGDDSRRASPAPTPILTRALLAGAAVATFLLAVTLFGAQADESPTGGSGETASGAPATVVTGVARTGDGNSRGDRDLRANRDPRTSGLLARLDALRDAQELGVADTTPVVGSGQARSSGRIGVSVQRGALEQPGREFFGPWPAGERGLAIDEFSRGLPSGRQDSFSARSPSWERGGGRLRRLSFGLGSEPDRSLSADSSSSRPTRR